MARLVPTDGPRFCIRGIRGGAHSVGARPALALKNQRQVAPGD
jgi:hypothetical protein